MKILQLFILFLSSLDLLFSQENILPSIKNIRDFSDSNEVNIYYDLDGKIDQEYKITLFMKILYDKPIEIELKNVIGDVGVGRFTGNNRKITWKGESFDGINELDENTKIIYRIKADIFSRSISNSNPIYDTLKNLYYIYYDLEGKPDDEYNVSVFLNIYKDNIVCKKLDFVEGDVGLCKCAGRNRKITWDILKDTAILGELGDNIVEFNVTSFAPEKFIVKAEPIIEHLEIERSANLIYIYYDLKGKSDEEYDVSAFLDIYKDTIIRKKLDFVKGDVGLCNCIGNKRKITWEILKDTAIIRELGSDIHKKSSFAPEKFIVKAEPVIKQLEIEKSSDLKYWIAGGVILVGGIVAYIIIPPPPPPQSYLPVPSGIERPLK